MQIGKNEKVSAVISKPYPCLDGKPRLIALNIMHKLKQLMGRSCTLILQSHNVFNEDMPQAYGKFILDGKIGGTDVILTAQYCAQPTTTIPALVIIKQLTVQKIPYDRKN